VTARVAFSFHPEVLCRSAREESEAYAHFEAGRLMCFEFGGVVFSVHQWRAITERSEWDWETFVRELRFLAEDQRPEPRFVPVEVRCG
jgi:hypothetical protein